MGMHVRSSQWGGGWGRWLYRCERMSLYCLYRKAVLQTWKRNKKTDATYENLIKACLEGDTSIAQLICKFIQENTEGTAAYLQTF